MFFICSDAQASCQLYLDCNCLAESSFKVYKVYEKRPSVKQVSATASLLIKSEVHRGKNEA